MRCHTFSTCQGADQGDWHSPVRESRTSGTQAGRLCHRVQKHYRTERGDRGCLVPCKSPHREVSSGWSNARPFHLSVESNRDKPLAARQYHQEGDEFRPVMLEVMDEETGELIPMFGERRALREALEEKEQADEEGN